MILSFTQHSATTKPWQVYLQVVVRIALIILVIEFLIMLVLALPLFNGLPGNVVAVVDALMLTTVSAPLIYFFIIKPFMQARDASHNFLQTVMAALSHPFYVVDANTYQIVYANSVATHGRDCPHMTCHQLTHLRETPCSGDHLCPLEAVKRTKQPVVVEHIHYDDKGGERNVEVYGYPIVNKRGEVVQMIEYSLDITSRKQAEGELASRTEKELIQRERMAALGELVSGFTHDLKTPVGVARGSVTLINELYRNVKRMMREEEVAEDELMGALQRIDEAAQLADSNLKHAAEMITSLKRISIDQTSGRHCTFALKPLINDTVTSLHHLFKRSAVTILVECDEGLDVSGSPGSWVQVLTNLLNNALIHAFDSGQSAGTIRIRGYREEGAICLDLQDDGRGMDESTRARVFERFFTTAEAEGGNGVGLYTTHALITAEMGGNISCSSTLGEGSCFHIVLPVNRG